MLNRVTVAQGTLNEGEKKTEGENKKRRTGEEGNVGANKKTRDKSLLMTSCL